MKKITQKDLIKERLFLEGKVSRNWCLGKYITRLGARINDLRKEGIETDGRFVNTEFGKDYVYFLKVKYFAPYTSNLNKAGIQEIQDTNKFIIKSNQNQLFTTKRTY